MVVNYLHYIRFSFAKNWVTKSHWFIFLYYVSQSFQISSELFENFNFFNLIKTFSELLFHMLELNYYTFADVEKKIILMKVENILILSGVHSGSLKTLYKMVFMLLKCPLFDFS